MANKHQQNKDMFEPATPQLPKLPKPLFQPSTCKDRRGKVKVPAKFFEMPLFGETFTTDMHTHTLQE